MSSRKFQTFRLLAAVLSSIALLASFSVAAQSVGQRITAIQNDIMVDEMRLEEMRANLKMRNEFFEEFTARSAGYEQQAAAIVEQLREFEGVDDQPDAEQIAQLKLQQASLLERAEQEKRKATVVVEAIKISKAEIQLTEAKLKQEQLALSRLLGEEGAESEERLPTEGSQSAEPMGQESSAEASSSSLSSMTALLPGSGGKSTTNPTESTGTTGKVSLAETGEQIQARKRAEKTLRTALEAEQQFLEFVERKQALVEQIAMEEAQVALGGESQNVIAEELEAIERDIALKLSQGLAVEDTQEEQQRSADLEEIAADVASEVAKRKRRLEEMQARLNSLEDIQVDLAEEVELTRRQAEKASEQRIWAYSPANPANILRWLRIRGPGILLVMATMLALLMLTRFAARRVIRFLVRSAQPAGRPIRGQRAETVAGTLGSVVTGIVVVIALMIVLQEAGVDIATLLGGAAIFGVAVAFGAQNLMKDYFNGFMILVEDQYGLDDLVSIGEVEGRVERVTMRTTVVRDIEGRLHFIPNGQIALVTNRSYEWSRAMLDIPVPYDTDLDRAMEILMEVANEFCEDMNYTQSVADKPEMLGVNEYAESAIMIRFFIKTAPSMQLPVKREMLRRIKQRFDKEGISIPYPHRVVIQGNSND